MFKKGFFIPNVVHPEPSDMRGIYIPYYVTNIVITSNSDDYCDLRNETNLETALAR